jgi:prepilin signal peptidase PulO-like enzyme (type II secretory pathway)
MVIFVLAFILGAAFGSFVGVIAQRLYVAPIIDSRSKCLSCTHVLSWKDMIPAVSCLSLKGRCRYCYTKFGYAHAFFEIAFGLIFVFLVHRYVHFGDSGLSIDWKDLLLQFSVTLTLGVIFLYDLAHRIIPKHFLYFLLTLSLLPLAERFLQSGSYYGLAAPLLVALPYLILFFLTLGKGVGFGDVLLFFGVGALLGSSQGLLVFLFSLWIGTLTVLPLLFFKIVNKKTALPFAPFIIISYFVVLFTGWQISDLISFVYHVML